MLEQAATVEPNGQKANSAAASEVGGSTPPERPVAKFVYSGGSKPLEGYTIKRGIGHGGFGEIYYALSDAGKEVALKLIRRNLEVELRGIRHCLNLKHPNLLSLYDIRQDEHEDTWVVMEYVSGDSLEDMVAAHPDGMPLPEVLAWMHGIGAGVAYLHDRGIVHRDLKPGNIFSDEGVVKVGDYGLSKFISCSRRSGQTESVGTVHYMAPEVANGRYGKEIDVYAMGVILYEMLTGRVPFEGESVGEVLMKHLTAKPDVSMLSEPYRSVVARALEKDPANRFRSMGEMLAALPQPAGTPGGVGRLPSGAYRGAAAAAAGPLAETVVRAELGDEEPILRAARDGWRKLRTSWDQANLATPVKVALLVVMGIALLLSFQVVVPLLVVLVIMYGVYWVIRALVLSGNSQKSTPQARWTPTAPSAAPRRVPPQPPRQPGPAPYAPSYARTPRPATPRERAALALIVKPPRERLTELLGSLLGSALVAIPISLVMLIVNTFHTGSDPQPERGAWLVLVSIAGAWAVLIPAKFWEGTRGEAVLRRFTMMVIGLGLGLLAFELANLLLVDLPHDVDSPGPHVRMPASFYVNGQPQALAFVAAFGTLFLLMRWWRQADPLRAARLSFWSMLVSVVMAIVVAAVWQFPIGWLAMTAGTMSVATQLASPWMNPRERTRR